MAVDPTMAQLVVVESKGISSPRRGPRRCLLLLIQAGRPNPTPPQQACLALHVLDCIIPVSLARRSQQAAKARHVAQVRHRTEVAVMLETIALTRDTGALMRASRKWKTQMTGRIRWMVWWSASQTRASLKVTTMRRTGLKSTTYPTVFPRARLRLASHSDEAGQPRLQAPP